MSDLSDLRESANESAKVARTNLLFFLAVTLFFGLLVGGTNDLLLLKRAEITLPLMEIGVPIDVFYRFGPIIFILLHLNIFLRLGRVYQVANQFRKEISRLEGIGKFGTAHARIKKLKQTSLLFSFDFLQLIIHKIIRDDGPDLDRFERVERRGVSRPDIKQTVVNIPDISSQKLPRPDIPRIVVVPPDVRDLPLHRSLWKNLIYAYQFLFEHIKHVTQFLFEHMKYRILKLFYLRSHLLEFLFQKLRYVVRVIFQRYWIKAPFQYLKYWIFFLFRYLKYKGMFLWKHFKYVVREYGYFLTFSLIVLASVFVLPLALLIFIQLTFLPYQSVAITSLHQWLIAGDIAMQFIFLWSLGLIVNPVKKWYKWGLKFSGFTFSPFCKLGKWIGKVFAKTLKFPKFVVCILHPLKIVVRSLVSITVPLILISFFLVIPATSFTLSWFVALPPDVADNPSGYQEPQNYLTRLLFNDWWIKGSCELKDGAPNHRWPRRYIYLPPDTSISKSELPPEIVATYLAESEIPDHTWEFIDPLDLSNRSLRYGWFESNVFWRANFSDSSVHCANFQNSKLHGAVFSQKHADEKDEREEEKEFLGANFHGADIRDSRFQNINENKMEFIDTSFFKTEFQGGEIHGALFQNVKGDKVKFSDTDLSDTKFHGGTMRDSIFNNVNSEKIKFENIDLSRTKFDGGEIKNSTFQGTAGEEIEFVDIDLSETQFHGADIKNAMFQGVRGEYMKFFDTDCTGTKFHGVDFSNASFEGANLSDTEIHGSELDSVEFKGTLLDDAEIYGVIADGATFTGVYARNADFYGINFHETKEKKVQLTATNLYSSNFYASDLSMVNLSFVDVQQFGCVAPEKREPPVNREQIETKIVESLGERNLSEKDKKDFLAKIKNNAKEQYGSTGLGNMKDISYDNQCIWADGYGPFKENFDLSDRCLSGLYNNLIGNNCSDNTLGMVEIMVAAVTDQDKSVKDQDISLPSHVAVKLLQSSEKGCNAITANHRIAICGYLKNWFSQSKSQSREPLESHITEFCGPLPKNPKIP